jgi:TusE/DsrC/DsvC family sulfur relay protein
METAKKIGQNTVPRPTPAAATESVVRRLDTIEDQLAYLVKRQKKQEELFADMTPIAKEILRTVTERFGELEQEGVIAFAKELLVVTRKVVQHYGPEDVRQLGGAVVKILDTVRALTQPEVLAIAEEASGVLQNADQAQPIGLMGMVRASRDEDVQKGMAVMMEVVKHVGRGAKALSEQRREPSAADRRKERLASRLGPRKKKVLGVERPAAARAREEAVDLGPPVACSAPAATPQEAVTTLDGIGFTADGHLADPKQWSRDLAVTLAEAQSIPLDEARWKVIEMARGDFEQHGAAPNVRRITMITGLSTRDLYTMFPRAPARTIAKIAGIPKPVGCI